MYDRPTVPARRRLLLAAAGLVTAALPGIAAAGIATPQQMRGPFYPDRMPLDQDNDLTRLMDGDPSQGDITDLTGRVLDLDGKPVQHALVEIWQCDANGRYIHSGDEGGRPRDPGFQGYGKTRFGSDGGYRFRAIKPVPYPGRAPHIHVAVTTPGLKPLVTQLYVDGARENTNDFLRSLLSAEELTEVTVPFRPSGEPLQAPGGAVRHRHGLSSARQVALGGGRRDNSPYLQLDIRADCRQSGSRDRASADGD